jgi:hypothetical protein
MHEVVDKDANNRQICIPMLESSRSTAVTIGSLLRQKIVKPGILLFGKSD